MHCMLYKTKFFLSNHFVQIMYLANTAIFSRQIVLVPKHTYHALRITIWMETTGITVWKLREFSLTHFWRKFRESNGFINYYKLKS